MLAWYLKFCESGAFIFESFYCIILKRIPTNGGESSKSIFEELVTSIEELHRDLHTVHHALISFRVVQG